jgi:hypothetical protein
VGFVALDSELDHKAVSLPDLKVVVAMVIPGLSGGFPIVVRIDDGRRTDDAIVSGMKKTIPHRTL